VLRPAVLGVAGHPWFRWLATQTPPGRAVALRFVAGETLDEAMAVARELDRGRVTAMLDHLGENVATLGQADTARDDYLRALAAIGRAPALDCAISVKLTQLGLDASVGECLERVWPVLETAAETGTQRHPQQVVQPRVRVRVQRDQQFHDARLHRLPVLIEEGDVGKVVGAPARFVR
jgi:proline dehydrogenase